MILTSELMEQAASLAETPDEILPLFPPLERATIMAAKEIMKKERKSPASQAGQREHQNTSSIHKRIAPSPP